MIENVNNDSCLNFDEQKLSEADTKRFKAILCEDHPDRLVSEDEAADAYRNLGEFVVSAHPRLTANLRCDSSYG